MMICRSDIFIKFAEQITELRQCITNFVIPAARRQVIRISHICGIHFLLLLETNTMKQKNLRDLKLLHKTITV